MQLQLAKEEQRRKVENPIFCQGSFRAAQSAAPLIDVQGLAGIKDQGPRETSRRAAPPPREATTTEFNFPTLELTQSIILPLPVPQA